MESRIGFGDATTTGYGRQRATEFGQRFEYRRETLNYGEFVLQADGRHLGGDNSASGIGIGSLGYAREATSGRFTLRNLGFPLTTQTFADTAVGDIYSEVTDGLARNYRLTLGSSTVRGASTRIFSTDLDVRAGIGQRGNLTGGPYPGFEKSQGTLGWLGATLRLGDPWFASFQLDQARDIPAYYIDPITAMGIGRKDVTSWATSIGYGREVVRDGDFKARATLVGSRVNSPTPGVATGNSQGLFIEASARTGLYRHEFGIYTARPNLYFGDYALATGTRGAYWRVDRNTSRMSWGAGLDYERARRTPASISRATGASARAATSSTCSTATTPSAAAWSAYRTRYDGLQDGGTRPRRQRRRAQPLRQRLLPDPLLRLAAQPLHADGAAQRADRARRQRRHRPGSAVGAGLIGGRYETMRPELTTTLGHARDSSGGTTRSYLTAGLQFRYWIDSGFNVGGNLRYTSQSGGLYTSRGLSGSLMAEKELGRGLARGLHGQLQPGARIAAADLLFRTQSLSQQ